MRYADAWHGRLAQRESASFTPRRSLVRSQYRPPAHRPVPNRGTGLFYWGAAAKCSNGARQASQSPSFRSASRVPVTNLGVDLHRDTELAMPQDAHRDARVDIEGGQQRGAGLAGAMHGDPRHVGGGDATVEAAAEVPWLEGRAIPGSEHQAGINPGTVGAVAVTPPSTTRPAPFM